MTDNKPTVTEPVAENVATPPAPTGVSMPAPAGSSTLPAELKGWNWGAFFLSWIWGIGHRVWITLIVLVLGFIPVVGGIAALVMAVILGLKGNEWAWQNRHFESVEQFKKVQKAWAIWGLVIFILGLVFMFTMGLTLFDSLKDANAS